MEYELIILDREGWRRRTLPLGGNDAERLLFEEVRRTDQIAEVEKSSAARARRRVSPEAKKARRAAAARERTE